MRVFIVLCIVTLVADAQQGHRYNGPAKPSHLYDVSEASNNAPIIPDQSRIVQATPSQLYSSPDGLSNAPTTREQLPAQTYLPAREQLPIRSDYQSNRNAQGYYYNAPEEPSHLYDVPEASNNPPIIPDQSRVVQATPSQLYSSPDVLSNVPTTREELPAQTYLPAREQLPIRSDYQSNRNAQGYYYNAPAEPSLLYDVPEASNNPPIIPDQSRVVQATPSQLYSSPDVLSNVPTIREELPAQTYLPAREQLPIRSDYQSNRNAQGYYYNAPAEPSHLYDVPEASNNPPIIPDQSRVVQATPSQLYSSPDVLSNVPTTREELPAQTYLPAREQLPIRSDYQSNRNAQGYYYNTPAEPSHLYDVPETSNNAPIIPDQSRIVQATPSQLYSSPDVLSNAPTTREQLPAQTYLPAREQLPIRSDYQSNRNAQGYYYNTPAEPSHLYDVPEASNNAPIIPDQSRIVQATPSQLYSSPDVLNNAPIATVPFPSQTYLPASEELPISSTREPYKSLVPVNSYLPASSPNQGPYDYTPKDPLQVSVSKHYYVETPREYIPNYPNRHSSTKKHTHYKLIFIRAPTHQAEHQQIQQQQKEEKTLIYVLSQKSDGLQYLPPYGPPAPELSQPEVFFIKYKTPEEAARAQEQIQAQYDALSNTGYPPVAPPQGFGNPSSVPSYIPPSY